eukprot:8408699-Pyramimonas_sp.AAC.1
MGQHDYGQHRDAASRKPPDAIPVFRAEASMGTSRNLSPNQRFLCVWGGAPRAMAAFPAKRCQTAPRPPGQCSV